MRAALAETAFPVCTLDAVALLHGEPHRYNIPMLIDHFGVCRNTIVRRLRKLGVEANRRQRPKGERGSAQTRHKPHAIAGKSVSLLAFDNPALTEKRTIFPSTVKASKDVARLLIDGVNSKKIGRVITKGRWKGFPVFTLTLEERATCPTSCQHWRSCYGSQMWMAQRIRHDSDLLGRLNDELFDLSVAHPKGFAVRLHVLGDFYSVDYVEFWRQALIAYPALHVFGFTARVDGRNDPIAAKLIALVMERWGRFAIRFSNAPVDECSTVSIEHPFQKPADAIICPQQLGKTTSCSTCALCWQSKRRIAFIRH